MIGILDAIAPAGEVKLPEAVQYLPAAVQETYATPEIRGKFIASLILSKKPLSPEGERWAQNLPGDAGADILRQHSRTPLATKQLGAKAQGETK
jgi:hypothetical protein